MSLIMTYIGSKGCVMVGDKRSIGFLGNKDQREILEEELYSGKIKTDEKLIKRADELGINLKITDDGVKVRDLGKVLVGEVKVRATHETKRKRIYATTNGYHQVELSGSQIKNVKSGKSSIVIFGNKITKELASKELKRHWKSKINLEEVKDIFKKVIEKLAQTTPYVRREYDIFMIYRQMDHKQAMELLRTTLIHDVKKLTKWRKTLRKEMQEQRKDIQI